MNTHRDAMEDARRFLARVPTLIAAGAKGAEVAGFTRVDPARYDGVVCLVAKRHLNREHGRLRLTAEVVDSLLKAGSGFVTLPAHLARAVVNDLGSALVEIYAWEQGHMPLTSIDTRNDQGYPLDSVYHDWGFVRYALTPHRDGISPTRDRPRPPIEWGALEKRERIVSWTARWYLTRQFTLVGQVAGRGAGTDSREFNVRVEGRLVFASDAKAVICPAGLLPSELSSTLAVQIQPVGSVERPPRALLPRIEEAIQIVYRLLVPDLAVTELMRAPGSGR